MKKEGRAIVVVVLLIFFIIAVAVCGYFMIKLDKKEKEMQSIQEELSQIKEELKNKNEEIKEEAKQQKEEVSIDVDALNKEHCERILGVLGNGSSKGQYFSIMNREYTTENLEKYFDESNKITRNNLSYTLTIDDYSEYENEWKKIMSEELMKKILGFKGIIDYSNMIINVDGKVAVNDGQWSGGGKFFVSQKQISKNDNSYVYEVKYNNVIGMDPVKYEEKTAIVTGRVEGSNYIIEKFENK